MTGLLKYGDVALGVESALPVATRPAGRHGGARRFITWLVTALRRWA